MLVHETVRRELMRQAKDGYESKGKEERFGFLFGCLNEENILEIKRSCSYRGGKRTRTSVNYKERPMHKRRLELAKELNMTYLGNYHCHVEIGGRISCGLSEDDRQAILEDPYAWIEILVAVFASKNKNIPLLTKSIPVFEPSTGYQYRFRFYTKNGGRIGLIPTEYIKFI
jgi:proteasome lid subunit RPN8/RPN11